MHIFLFFPHITGHFSSDSFTATYFTMTRNTETNKATKKDMVFIYTS